MILISGFRILITWPINANFCFEEMTRNRNKASMFALCHSYTPTFKVEEIRLLIRVERNFSRDILQAISGFLKCGAINRDRTALSVWILQFAILRNRQVEERAL